MIRKQVFYAATLFLASCSVVAAQVESAVLSRPSSQITVQGSGLFAKSVKDPDVTYKPETTEGVMVGYRYCIFRWLGVEGDANYFLPAGQKYTLLGTPVSLKTNASALTGAVVFNLPNPMTKKLQSFASVGGGAMIFRPTDFSASVDYRIRNVVVFGGGMDLPMTRHFAIRAEVNTFLYKAPDFENTDLKVTKFTQALVPSAGIIYKF
jgi:hypothetical protein